MPKGIVPVLLAFLGIVVSAYLAAYQLGWIRSVWDPVFGPAGSRAVLHSALDRLLPIPDALLGAGAYLAETALGLAIVAVQARAVRLLYGLVAAAMALVSLGLVATQAFVVGDGCSLCLLSAVLSWTIAVLVAPDAFRRSATTPAPEIVTDDAPYRRAA